MPLPGIQAGTEAARKGSMGLIVSRHLDPQSQLHLRKFAGHAGLLVLCCAPALLIDEKAPVLFLSLLGTVCRFTALFLFIVGFSVRGRSPEAGFGPWDHCLAFVLLQLGCSIALDLIR
jgi:hypothetical protein